MAAPDDQRDVICLRGPTEFFHACLNHGHEFIRGQISICLDEPGESIFAILFTLQIRCLGYPICADDQDIARV